QAGRCQPPGGGPARIADPRTFRSASKRTLDGLNAQWLTAWLRRGAVNVRVNARIVQGAGGYRLRYCAGFAAAADGPFVIAALPGGGAADDQPDEKKHRAEAH